MFYYDKKVLMLFELMMAPLKPEYKKLLKQGITAGAVIGSLLVLLIGYALGAYLDIPFREPIRNYGTTGWVWLVLFLLLIIPAMFLGFLLSFVAFAVIGKITLREAFQAAFTITPPKRWLEDEYKSLGE